MTQRALPQRLDLLTSLRFFAALHVTLFHIQGESPWPVPRVLNQLVGTGFVSVSFFFVLSGFILTFGSATRSPRERLREYAWSRFARLYPLYALGLLGMVPAWLKHRAEAGFVPQSLATIALLQAWVPSWAMAWNPPAWSLSVEAFFYVLFPFVLPWVLRAPIRRLWAMVATLWVLGVALACAFVLRFPQATGDDFWLNALKFHPLIRCPEFLIGMALARSFRDGPWPVHIERWGLLAAIGLVVVVATSWWAPYPVLHNGLLTPFFVVIIAAAATPSSSVVHRVLSHRWLIALGEASYALYILQATMLGVVHGVMKRVAPDQPLVSVLLSVLVCVAGSVVAWRFIEKPARAFILEKTKRRAA